MRFNRLSPVLTVAILFLFSTNPFAADDKGEKKKDDAELWKIARDPEARALLPVRQPKSKREVATEARIFPLQFLGEVRTEEKFQTEFMLELDADKAKAKAAYEKKEAECKKKFGMPLFDLFKLYTVRSQGYFLANEDAAKLIIGTADDTREKLLRRCNFMNRKPPRPLEVPKGVPSDEDD